MSASEQLLDTSKEPKEAVPREDLDDAEFDERVRIWRDYLADAVNGPKIEVEEHSTYYEVSGVSVSSGREFQFSFPFQKDIQTTYGVSKNCELLRVDFYPKKSGEQFRAQYLVKDLPEGKQNDSFATDEKTRNVIVVTYDAESNDQKNVCLNLDQFGYSSKGSPRMIPLFVRDKS